ncbi:MAG TPA: hypothetical protein DEV93_02415 [Chloroflexi bacterium]|nr:hypothetical protein [Chloroflexota bacterium]
MATELLPTGAWWTSLGCSGGRLIPGTKFLEFMKGSPWRQGYGRYGMLQSFAIRFSQACGVYVSRQRVRREMVMDVDYRAFSCWVPE